MFEKQVVLDKQWPRPLGPTTMILQIVHTKGVSYRAQTTAVCLIQTGDSIANVEWLLSPDLADSIFRHS